MSISVVPVALVNDGIHITGFNMLFRNNRKIFVNYYESECEYHDTISTDSFLQHLEEK